MPTREHLLSVLAELPSNHNPGNTIQFLYHSYRKASQNQAAFPLSGDHQHPHSASADILDILVWAGLQVRRMLGSLCRAANSLSSGGLVVNIHYSLPRVLQAIRES